MRIKPVSQILLLWTLLLTSSSILGQNNVDCDKSVIICSDSTFTFEPTGPGFDDFDLPNNSVCFEEQGIDFGRNHESNAAWYYFEFNDSMPPNSVIEFVISAQLRPYQDFDFSLFGPNVRCDSLGEPVRCSYSPVGSGEDCDVLNVTIETGLVPGATDSIENLESFAEAPIPDGLLAPLVVQPGDGFFLIIDFFSDNSQCDNTDIGIDPTPFTMDWDGSAAPFLNCIANPFCYTANADAGRDTTVCAGSTVPLEGIATNVFLPGSESYRWKSSLDDPSIFENPNAPNTNLRIPPDFSGTLTVSLSVAEGNCVLDDQLTIEVLPAPVVSLSGDDFICPGETAVISVTPGYDSYIWEGRPETTPSITVDQPGVYRVRVVDDTLSCDGFGQWEVEAPSLPEPEITGDSILCPGEAAVLDADNGIGFPNYLWSTGETAPNVTVDATGTYSVTVTTPEGCDLQDEIFVEVKPTPSPVIAGANFCSGAETTLNVTPGPYQSFEWNNGVLSENLTISDPGSYQLTVIDTFGCTGSSNILTIDTLESPRPQISGDLAFCIGTSTELDAGAGFIDYRWSDNSTGQNITVDSVGDYAVTVTAPNGCPGTDTVTVTNFPVITPDIQGDTIICTGETTTLSAQNPAFQSYLWPDGSTAPTFTTGVGGTYEVSVVDNNNCTLIDSISLQVRPLPVPEITGTDYFCEDNTTELIANDGMSAYLWSTGDTTRSIDLDIAGNVSVTITDNFGCQNQLDTNIIERPNPAPDVIGETRFCSDTLGTIRTDIDFASYQWSTGANTRDLVVDQAGAYFVTVTDDFGCEGVGLGLVDTFEVPRPRIVGDPSFCTGDSTLLAADQIYSAYRWSTSASTPEVQIDQPGVYRLEVDNANCTGADSIEVLENPLPTVTIQGDTALCPTEVTDLSVPDAFAAYQWENGETDTGRIDLGPGTYSITVTDANGCAGSDTLDVRAFPNPTPQIIGPDTFCANTTVELRLDQSYESYFWASGTQTSFDSVYLAQTPEVVAVRVSDIRGCTGDDVIQLDTFPVPQIRLPQDTLICEGTTARFDPGGGFAQYQWSAGQSTVSITPSQPGNYSVTVTSADGCSNTDSVRLAIQENPEPRITGPDVLCTGDSIVLTGDPGFSIYEWNDAPGSDQLTVFNGGTYALQVADSIGCVGTDSFAVQAFTSPSPIISGPPEFCEGEVIELQTVNGYESYQWSDGSVAPTLNVDSTGNYTVQVTDSNGCRGAGAFLVTERPNPEPDIQGDSILCQGESRTLNVGTGFASYEWSNGSTNAFIEVTVGGSYWVEVANDFNCTARDTFFLEPFEVDRSNLSEEDRSLCTGDTLTLDAGFGLEQYVWSTGDTTPVIQVTSGADLRLRTLDQRGCADTIDIRVNEFIPQQPSIGGGNNFCRGESLILVADGNFQSYQWSTGEVSKGILINRGDTYGLTVTDFNGCTSSVEKEIIEKASPPVEFVGDTVICEGDTATLSVRVPGEGYLWTTEETDSVINITRGGFYGVQVFYDNGCIAAGQLEILAGRRPETFIRGDRVFCQGDSTVLRAANTLPVYLWSDGSTGQSLVVREPGVYALTVADSLGCSNTFQALVEEAALPEPEILGDRGICPGDSVLLRITGALSAIQWSNGENDDRIWADSAGLYTIEVTDLNGCRGADTVQVSDLPAPDFTIEGDPFFCEGTETEIGVSAFYPIYRWADGPVTRTRLVNRPGDYAVEVTDENGCQASRLLTVEEIPDPQADAGPPARLDCYEPTVRLGGPATSVGDNFAYDWTGPGITDEQRSQPFPRVNQAGTFRLVVTDTTHNCASTIDAVTITDERFVPNLQARALDTFDCITDAVVVDFSGSFAGDQAFYRVYPNGFPPAAFSANTAFEINQPRAHLVEVIDSLTGCRTVDTLIPIVDRKLPFVDAGPDRQLTCLRDSVVLTARADGGVRFPFEWIVPQNAFVEGRNTLRPTVRSSGIYRLQIRDRNNGCENTDSVRVVWDTLAPLADAGPDRLIDCAVTEITLLGRGAGADGLNYRWTGLDSLDFNANVAQPTVDRPGDYLLKVINIENGCEGTDSVQVNLLDNAPEAADVLATSTTCFDTEDGIIEIFGVEGGTGPFLYGLLGQPLGTEPLLQDLPAGTYDLIVQDANGCELVLAAEVGRGNDLSVDLGEDQFIDLGDSATIQALVNIPKAEVGSIEWWSEDTINCLRDCDLIEVGPISTTSYRATVRDLNGCVASDIVTIFVDRSRNLYIPNAFSPNLDGRNDIFYIYSNEEQIERITTFQIYSRWGEMVFQTEDFQPNDPAFGWDGNHKGKPMDAGVFVYYVEAEFVDGSTKSYEGEVILVR